MNDRMPPLAPEALSEEQRSAAAWGAGGSRPGRPGRLLHYGVARHERRPYAGSAAAGRSAVGTIPELAGARPGRFFARAGYAACAAQADLLALPGIGRGLGG